MVQYLHSFFGFKHLTPAQKIAASFLLVILLGTVLLMLPISHRDHQMYSLIDALFTATSATCVTGLVVNVTVQEFTIFGQAVILLLIQIGGLGLMTLMAVFILLLKSRLSMHEKMAMKEMLNQDQVFNMHRFLMDILKYTLLFEGCGMVVLALRFIPDFGIMRGLFKALFVSVSAFCNAGFDNLGAVSLIDYVHDPLVIIPVMALIVLGGLGFAVWFDLRDKIKLWLKREISLEKFRKSLSLHTKIVLFMTMELIAVTATFLFLLEFQNKGTIGSFQWWEKGLTSLFESVTLRTAGFASVNYAQLTMASKFLMILVMFVGGSPGGTAGGVKTTTLAVLVLFIIANLRGHIHTVMFRRSISREIIVRAMSIFFINLLTLITGVFLLCILEDKAFIDLLFEATSALATVGLTLGITSSLSLGGKIIIILLMFVGRIGITTFVMSLVSHHNLKQHNAVAYPNGTIIVG